MFFYSRFLLQKHILQLGQCLPKVCSTNDIKTIINADNGVMKFNQMYANGTIQHKNGISALHARRVPGDYAASYDPTFYLIM